MDQSRLREALAALGSDALLVVASSSRDPDLAPFTGSGRLGQALVVVGGEGQACIGFLNAMERDEAALSELDPLGPRALGVDSESGLSWTIPLEGTCGGPVTINVVDLWLNSAKFEELYWNDVLIWTGAEIADWYREEIAKSDG